MLGIGLFDIARGSRKANFRRRDQVMPCLSVCLLVLVLVLVLLPPPPLLLMCLLCSLSLESPSNHCIA